MLAGYAFSQGLDIAGVVVSCVLIIGLVIRGVIKVTVGDKTAEIDMTGQERPQEQPKSRGTKRPRPKSKK